MEQPESALPSNEQTDLENEKQNALRTAIVELEARVAKDPTSSLLINNLAAAYQSAGLHFTAMEHYARALELNPSSGQLMHNIAGCFNEMYMIEEAKLCLLEAIRLEPDNKFVYPQLLHLRQYMGDWVDIETLVDVVLTQAKTETKQQLPDDLPWPTGLYTLLPSPLSKWRET